MEIKIRAQDNVVILDLSGTVDVNAALLIETVGQCLRDGYTDILCNFEEVEMIDYMGISVLVIAFKEVANRGGRLRCCNAAAHFKNLFAVAGVDKVIEQFPNEALALVSFKEDKEIENIKKMQLRRRFKRLPVDIKIGIQKAAPGSPVCTNAEIVNLSGVGAYIFGCNQFSLGDDVRLSFSLPPAAGSLEVEGKVVWLADKQVQPHLYPGIGVAFPGIPSSLQEQIVSFVERNASCLPDEG